MDILKLNDCPAFLKDFLFYMESIKGRSQRTVEAYYIDLRLFLRFIKFKFVYGYKFDDDIENILIDDFDVSLLKKITLSDVYEFLNYVLSNRSNNAATRARKVSSLRSFFKYASSKANLLDNNPVQELEVPTIKKSLPKYLTLDESKRLLKNTQSIPEIYSADNSDTDKDNGEKQPAKPLPSYFSAISERDFCMITLFLNCGMRLSELVSINLQDLNIVNGKIHDNALKILGKGNKERQIYLNSACIEAIEKYLPHRQEFANAKEPNAMFLSRRGTRLTPRRVEQIVQEHLDASGLSGKGYSVHKLRHTAATLLYQYGNVDIRTLQEILGHSNLSTTQIYTHVSDTQIKTAMERSPLSPVKHNTDK